MTNELKKAAENLSNLVVFDMNGTSGKGGNGGLLSDTTLRAAHEVQVILSRLDNPKHNPPPRYSCALCIVGACDPDTCFFEAKDLLATSEGTPFCHACAKANFRDLSLLSKFSPANTKHPDARAFDLFAEVMPDLVNLVIAAREAFDCAFLPEEESRALDKALEPFASKVRYANEPDEKASAELETAE